MFRHSLIVLFELAAGLLAVATILGGFLAYRLTQGPLQVDWLTPYVADSVNRASPIRVAIGGTRLSWAGWGAPLYIQAVDFTLFGDSGDVVARVPELRMGLSLPALRRLTLAPTEVALVRPHLTLVRTPQGRLRLDILGDDAPKPDSHDTPFMARLVDALRQPPNPTDPLGALTALRIEAAAVTLDDRMLGRTWTAPDVSLQLFRNAGGISGTVALDVEMGGRLNRMNGSLEYRTQERAADLALDFSDIQVAAVAELAPVLEPLKALEVGLSGTLRASLADGLQPKRIGLSLTGGKGRLVLPEQYPEPLIFESVGLEGRLEGNGDLLLLDRLALDFGRPTVTLAGRVARGEERLALALRAELTDVPAADLARMWPRAVKAEARDWIVGNLADGVFDSTVFELEGWSPTGTPGDLTPTRLDGRFAFSGWSVRYMDTLPPITGVKGTATFDGATFDIALTEGKLLDLVLAESKVRIHGLDTDDHAIAIDVPFSGPVASALAVLDHDPLNYAAKVNLVPETVGGTADMSIRFAFPLVKDLQMEQVRIDGKATMRGVTAAGIVPDVVGTDGDLALTVTDQGMRVTGTAKLNGVPARIDWEERFSDNATVPTRVGIQMMVDDAGRAAFDLAFPDWIRGPAAVDLVYTRPRQGNDTIVGQADLRGATLLIDVMDWTKEPGRPAAANATIVFIDGKPVRIAQFDVTTEEMTAVGRATLRPTDYGLQRVELDRFRLKDTTEAKLVILGREDGGMSIDVRGPRFDARPLRGGDEDKPKPPRDAEEPPGDPLTVEFALDRVIMGDEGQEVRQAEGRAESNGRIWTTAIAKATIGETGSMNLRYQPDGDTLALRLESDDAGALLRSFDILDQVRGGKLVVTGRSDPNDRSKTVAGQIDLRDYRVQDAPVLARILSAASPQGFANFLGGQPVAFTRLVGDFRWHRHGISFRDLRTSGAEVGLTLEGDIDLYDDKLDLQGTVVPFSTVNQVIGAIPLLGDLLTGGEGQGLFAATFNVTGPTDKPNIFVNPLAVLAPGFLRNLFFLGDPAGQDTVTGGTAPPRKPGGGSGGGGSGGGQQRPGIDPLNPLNLPWLFRF